MSVGMSFGFVESEWYSLIYLMHSMAPVWTKETEQTKKHTDIIEETNGKMANASIYIDIYIPLLTHWTMNIVLPIGNFKL